MPTRKTKARQTQKPQDDPDWLFVDPCLGACIDDLDASRQADNSRKDPQETLPRVFLHKRRDVFSAHGKRPLIRARSLQLPVFPQSNIAEGPSIVRHAISDESAGLTSPPASSRDVDGLTELPPEVAVEAFLQSCGLRSAPRPGRTYKSKKRKGNTNPYKANDLIRNREGSSSIAGTPNAPGADRPATRRPTRLLKRRRTLAPPFRSAPTLRQRLISAGADTSTLPEQQQNRGPNDVSPLQFRPESLSSVQDIDELDKWHLVDLKAPVVFPVPFFAARKAPDARTTIKPASCLQPVNTWIRAITTPDITDKSTFTASGSSKTSNPTPFGVDNESSGPALAFVPLQEHEEQVKAIRNLTRATWAVGSSHGTTRGEVAEGPLDTRVGPLEMISSSPTRELNHQGATREFTSLQFHRV